MTQNYQIVLAVDFDLASDVAAAHALELSRHMDADVLHVVHVLPAADARRGDHMEREEARLDAAYTKLRGYVVDHAIKLARGTWNQEVRSHVRLGDAAEAIHQVAVDYDADVIVVGTHHRTGIAKLVNGSVAEKLVNIARVPVVVACEKNFVGLPKTEVPEARRPGEDLSDQRPQPESRMETLTLGARTSHISGLL